ncbi:MAG: hypothetical protein PVI90_11845 [Desulfobacteraceae bacterium]|jgi:hypothetical protein
MNRKEVKDAYDWHDFCRYIVQSNRYIIDKNWSYFFDAILFTAKKRVVIYNKDIFLYRARIVDDEGKCEYEYIDEFGEPRFEIRPLPKNEIIAPPPEKAKNGRINPCGISFLYLSDKAET